LRQHLGIIGMIKWLVVGVFLFGSAIAIAHQPSKQYWESVGPKWDKILNPVNYEREKNGR
jgi:hypothetical protein